MLNSPAIVNALLPDSLEGINWSRGRAGKTGVPCPYPIDSIVEHVTQGDAASVREWFTNPRANDGKPSGVSSGYMVTRAGVIVQFVRDQDRAFHAGQLVAPTSKLVRERFANGGWSPNSYAIGVEHEGSGLEEMTDAQRAASYALHLYLFSIHPIVVDREHIIAHREVKATKTCPGKISVDRIVADLQSMLASAAPQDGRPLINDDYPRAVWSNVLKDYVAVVDYRGDSDWTYVPFRELAGKGKKAGAPLSQFPLRRPEP